MVAAERQTAGRGRLDRSWEAEAGAALLVSILLRPAGLRPSRFYLLTAAAGLAAREACQRVGGFTPDLKWPNDLLIGERKLAGILAEVDRSGGRGGDGAQRPFRPHRAGRGRMRPRARRIDRSELLAAWLSGLDHHLGDWDAVLVAYRRVCSTLGRTVAVELAGDRVAGTAEAIDDDGRLVVRDAGGARVVVSSGDVIHVRPDLTAC